MYISKAAIDNLRDNEVFEKSADVGAAAVRSQDLLRDVHQALHARDPREPPLRGQEVPEVPPADRDDPAHLRLRRAARAGDKDDKTKAL